MSVLKPRAGINSSPKWPNAGRRSFMWKAGTAASAVIASAAAGVSNAGSDPNASLRDQVDWLSNRIGRLEDANAIRRIHQTYESYLDRGLYNKVVDMFTDDGEVVFSGGLFSGKDRGVRRLFCDLFSSGMTGKKLELAPDFEQDQTKGWDIIEVAADRKSAKGQFPFSMQVGKPIADDCTLVKMARLQGQGIVKWWEGGICEASYVKVCETWEIKRLEYRVSSKADYRPGLSHARPIEVPEFADTYPKDPTGPDKLV